MNVAGLGASMGELGGYSTTIGTNLKIYSSGWAGNQYVKTLGVLKGAGYFTAGAGFLIDGALYKAGYQSGAKTATNMGVSGVSLYFGGVPGLIIGGAYFTIDKTVGWDKVIYYNYKATMLQLDLQERGIPRSHWGR